MKLGGLAAIAALVSAARWGSAQVPPSEAVLPATPSPAGAAEPTPAPAAAAGSASPLESPASATRSDLMSAYQRALAARRLSTSLPLSKQRLQEELMLVESKLLEGRRDEAIGELVYLVESPRFSAFASSQEGRAATFLLGDALGRAGALEPSLGYLGRLLQVSPEEIWYRRAVHSLVDLALESAEPAPFLTLLVSVPPSAPEELRGEVEYLRGRIAERAGDALRALSAYAKVSEHSRFWAQATYLSGLIEVNRRELRRGEELFCRVADPKRTPKRAALFGGGEFFRVRDLARLGLGRIAHEQFRFDDARYYYYLVPNDSERLPEALYETATTRYEAKDYLGARRALDELRQLDVQHPYQDEVWILDAYLDLALCRFPSADRKLAEFLKRYEPARDAARKLTLDVNAMRRLVATVRKGADPATAGSGVPEETARALGTLLRVDAGYGRGARRLAQLDHQLSGLRGALGELDEAGRRLGSSTVRQVEGVGPLGQTKRDRLQRIEGQLSELRRLIRDAERAGASGSADLEPLTREVEALELRARAARAELFHTRAGTNAAPLDLPALIAADRQRAAELYARATELYAEAEREQVASAREAFERLTRRLTRLLNRARLGRIETVLGKKRALEIEVEALSQGLLPQTLVDSLRAERYLSDDEEYWPFEGEDWSDEYVGGEGLR